MSFAAHVVWALCVDYMNRLGSSHAPGLQIPTVHFHKISKIQPFPAGQLMHLWRWHWYLCCCFQDTYFAVHVVRVPCIDYMHRLGSSHAPGLQIPTANNWLKTFFQHFQLVNCGASAKRSVGIGIFAAASSTSPLQHMLCGPCAEKICTDLAAVVRLASKYQQCILAKFQKSSHSQLVS